MIRLLWRTARHAITALAAAAGRLWSRHQRLLRHNAAYASAVAAAATTVITSDRGLDIAISLLAATLTIRTATTPLPR